MKTKYVQIPADYQEELILSAHKYCAAMYETLPRIESALQELQAIRDVHNQLFMKKLTDDEQSLNFLRNAALQMEERLNKTKEKENDDEN